MRNLTEITYIKVIDKNIWLEDRKNFKLEKSNFFNDKELHKNLIQTWYELTRWNLSSYLYKSYYLDLYKRKIWISIFIILVDNNDNVYEYLSVYEYFKRIFNLIFNLLDTFEYLHQKIYETDRKILKQLNVWSKISRNDIVELKSNVISYINSITKICENLDILLSLNKLVKWEDKIRIKNRDQFQYLNAFFWWKEKNKYFINIYTIRNYFLHKESPDFSFYLKKDNWWMLIYEKHFQFNLWNFTSNAFINVKGLLDYFFKNFD